LPGDSARKENIMEPSYENALALAGHAAGPLAEHLGPFVASLIEQQYAASVVYIKARHALSFDRWLAKRCVALADLGEVHIQQYQRRRRRGHRSIRAETHRREWCGVTQLLRFLRARGVCEAARIDSTPADDLVTAFERHLQQQKGLATATIKSYCRVASQFLHERFDRDDVDLRVLRATDAIEFVQRRAKRWEPSAVKCIVNAMRSFLRYAQYRGEIGPELAAAVPAVATWTTTPPLPKAISPEHAKRAIDSCDRRTSLGLRDRAVLLLLARLGLRAHEIIVLQLDDCDWDTGCLRVHSKGGRERLLPMPVDVGEAIAAYLERGRPVSQDRCLFLRSVAPIRGFMPGSDAIGSIVRYALRISSLRSLALPWPGGAR
jgi:site-specific recombinase XerD